MPKGRPEINVQDPLLFQWLKERQTVLVELVTGKLLAGRILRFDRFCLLVEVEDRTVLVYKHALSRIAATPNR